MTYNSGPQIELPSEHHADMVIALDNGVGVPVDTLGTVVEEASFKHSSLVLVEWYFADPASVLDAWHGRKPQPTKVRRAMRPTEIRTIEEG